LWRNSIFWKLAPLSKAPYRLNQKELKQFKRQLNDFFSRRYIWQSKSLYGAPILFIDKKDGKLKICNDYCALNKITIKNNYLLPHINDILDQLNEAKYFSQIDFKLGYYQILITNEDVEKIAMRTKYGFYEFLVMSSRLCNVPSMFTTFMNSIFHEKLNKFVIIYCQGHEYL
jgi:hypothetical protein